MPPKKSRSKFTKKGKGLFVDTSEVQNAKQKIAIKKITKIVDKRIHKNNETKSCFTVQSAINIDCTITPVTDINAARFVIPTMTKGTDDNDRIGDQIKPMSIKVMGHINTEASTNFTYERSRYFVRVMIIQPKSFSSQSDIIANAATWLGTLLKKGGTTASFTGIYGDIWADINSDAITTYFDKVYYVERPYNANPAANTNNNVTGRNVVRFKYNFKVKSKKLKYDDSIDSGTSNTQFNPLILVGFVPVIGVAGTAGQNDIQLNYVSYMKYEDS